MSTIIRRLLSGPGEFILLYSLLKSSQPTQSLGRVDGKRFFAIVQKVKSPTHAALISTHWRLSETRFSLPSAQGDASVQGYRGDGVESAPQSGRGGDCTGIYLLYKHLQALM